MRTMTFYYSCVFRCAASKVIGSGHVMRCLSLADMLKKNGWDCRFAVSRETLKTLPQLEQSEYQIVPPDYDETTTLLVVDHYGLDKEFEEKCRSWAKTIFVIDDLANRPHDCDILLDQTYGRNPSDYRPLVPEHCDILAGAEYALLRPEFSEIRDRTLKSRKARSGHIERILVSMGGTNIHDITSTVLTALSNWQDQKLIIDIVLGSGANALDNVSMLVKDINDKNIHKATLHIDAPHMADLMAQADLAIGSGGTTSWERCCLGLPTIMIEIADNQSLIANELNKAGAVINLGWHAELTNDKIGRVLSTLASDPDKIINMIDVSSKICNGRGRDKVYKRIKAQTEKLDNAAPAQKNDEYEITLRPFCSDDIEFLYKWQCIPDVRKHARNPKAPTWEEHKNWCEAILKNEEEHCYLIEQKKQPAGFARLNKCEDCSYEISILLDPAYQGQGIASKAINIMIKLFEGCTFKAYIYPENKKSISLFKNAGFKESDHNWYFYK